MSESMRPRLGSPATGVVIIGGASGIGLASAAALAAVGRPVAVWDLSEERASAMASDLAASCDTIVLGLGVDVRDCFGHAPSPSPLRSPRPTTRADVVGLATDLLDATARGRAGLGAVA